MQFDGYSNEFICYVIEHFQVLFENAYVKNTTTLKQLEYYSTVGTSTYNDLRSKLDILEHYKDIQTFLINNSNYKEVLLSIF